MLPIIQKRNWAFIFSGTLFFASIILLITVGLKPGLDFTGGSLMEVVFEKERPTVESFREVVSKNVENPVIQSTGEKGYLLKVRFLNEEEHQKLLSSLSHTYSSSTTSTTGQVKEDRFETIGSAVSSDLQSRAVQAGILVVLGIVAYIAYSFRKVSRPVQSWKYGVAAVVALIHDVIITMGFFVLLGKYKGVEVDLPFVVAMLTILGYSVNDTIVVFDRIREKLIRHGASNFVDTVNLAVNETVGRSINTSLTVLLALSALFLFGGASIHYFALALIIGIIFGTYSSIFVASSLLVAWEEWKHKRK